jgi:hypothetical protein
MEQIQIAHKRIMDAVRLLAAANEHALADDAESLAQKLDQRYIQYSEKRRSALAGAFFKW